MQVGDSDEVMWKIKMSRHVYLLHFERQLAFLWVLVIQRGEGAAYGIV